MLRLDRILSLGLVRPLRTLFVRAGGKARLPILMYHSVSGDREASVSPYYRVCVSPARFREQMGILRSEVHRGVTLREGLRWLREGGEGESPVVLTFDDGFRDFHDSGFPILAEHGFTATMYLATGYVGAERRILNGRECMNWDEVRALNAQGIEFGSHSVNHPKLYELPWPDINRELWESKASIEQELGIQVTAFAYPYAFPSADREFVGRFGDALKNSGYESCVTTAVKTAVYGDDLFELPRLPLNNDDDQDLVVAKLDGAYDWFGQIQALKKYTNHLWSRKYRKKINSRQT